VFGIIVISHGNLAEELINTSRGIIGHYPDIEAVTFMPGESLSSLSKKLKDCVNRVNKGDGVVILTDLFGGSCSNVCGMLLDAPYPIEILTGINLPMLLTLIAYRHMGPKVAAEKALESGVKGIVDLKRSLSKHLGVKEK
jgi:PTS system mannose-specific IIA component